jgi:hypothetical protein
MPHLHFAPSLSAVDHRVDMVAGVFSNPQRLITPIWLMPTWVLALSLYGVGLVYDLSFLLYASAPMALYLLLCLRVAQQQRWHKRLLPVRSGLVCLFIVYRCRGRVVLG